MASMSVHNADIWDQNLPPSSQIQTGDGRRRSDLMSDPSSLPKRRKMKNPTSKNVLISSAVAQLAKLTKSKNVESGSLKPADHVEAQEENEDGGEEDCSLICLCTHIYSVTTVTTSKLHI
ncbi:hypothetical protein DFH09DRAFT_1090203 [Mycena vulgaris]|nr:hypothetical protein DFH09DRAFT_1090203 [Mycena vulgaris]